MTNWNINPTMRKLSKQYPIDADSKEGQEIKELLEGMATNDEPISITQYAMYGYILGMARGKQLERARRRAGQQA